jgi:hypothetical protein
VGFSPPAAGGDNFTTADHLGKLVIIYPKTYNPAASTSKGITEAADADVVVCDSYGPDGQPLVFREARVFGNLARSVRMLTEQDGSPKKYLGRIGQGPNTKGTPPWILIDSSENPADLAMAGPVAQAFEQGQFAAPAPNPMAPPAAPATPAPGSGYGAPQQQWQPPQPAATQQWQQPPATSPPPQQQQWQQPQAPAAQWNAPAAAPPSATPAAPSPAPAASTPTVAYDPALAQFLQSRGITPPPDEATARAIAASLPQ